MIAYVLIALKHSDEKKIQTQLQKHKEVMDVHILFGEWDIMAKVNVSSPEELGTFVMEKIRSLSEVKLTSTLIVAK
ncbi:MAG: AsnC family transcriptional regulator [archaeon GW2011_AR3]|nr:MAG: AsnC family transcriptional regulator [archaeon GW2011_AR3]MBS3109236.1 Lrp/AsnC ligand binding domain-containing protein [Candidatus Woesearchaeota archaeon]